jgi:hypothetical protein
VCARARARAVRKKKRNKLAFPKRRKHSAGEEKQIQARKNSQFKSVDALAIAW